MKFEDWVFGVNFGDADLHEKHRSYMKLAFDARNEEISQLKKENEKLKDVCRCIKKYYDSFLKCSSDKTKKYCNNQAYCCCEPEHYIYRDIMSALKEMEGK